MSFPAHITGQKSHDDNPHRPRRRRSSAAALPASGQVPRAKKPKTRPPSSLRDKLGFLHGTLPKYTGPYSVGTMDIETPARHPASFSHIARAGRPLLRHETTLLALYYPSSPRAVGRGAAPPDGARTWSRSTWLPRPRRRVAAGYGRFAGMGEAAAVPWFAATTMFTKLPAFRNAPLAGEERPVRRGIPGPPRTAGVEEEEEEEEEEEREVGWEDEGEEGRVGGQAPKFPLLVFSHGLGGNRTAYSSVCGEFASHGFVVVALEHRDGSGPRTYVNHPHQAPCVKARLPSAAGDDENDGDGRPCRCPVDRKAGHDRIDYIFPKNNPIDTSPHAEKGVDHELRAAQIALRLAEIEAAYHVVELIAAGRGEHVAAANLRTKGHVGASSRGLDGVDWEGWAGRVHTQDVTVVGHSFGAATAVEMLRGKQRERFAWCTQGVMYDIWGAAVQPVPGGGGEDGEDPDEEEQQQQSDALSATEEKKRRSAATSNDPSDVATTTGQNTIACPLLGINSEAFMYWPSNFATATSLVRSALDGPDPCPTWLLTLRGTVHVSQSDFSLLYPHVCGFFLKQTANPRRAMDLNIDASLDFLARVLPARHAQALRRAVASGGSGGGGGEKLLDAPVVDEVPDDRRPEEKWIGGRLRVPHEFRSRVVPKLARKVKRQRRKGEEDEGAWDEVWMHEKSGEEEVRRYRERRGWRGSRKTGEDGRETKRKHDMLSLGGDGEERHDTTERSEDSSMTLRGDKPIDTD
ncbi:platelet-activating factor acetylhydrolase protein [Neofusicoccum parvum]|nr:platelet-activating factor acetylhydrolase protein [Neofusicoccum parvum]